MKGYHFIDDVSETNLFTWRILPLILLTTYEPIMEGEKPLFQGMFQRRLIMSIKRIVP